MSTKTRNELKAVFSENSVPTAADFAALIEAGINRVDDAVKVPAAGTLEVTKVKANAVEAATVTVSGLVQANAGISSTTVTASGLVEANAGISSTTVTATELVTAKKGLTVEGAALTAKNGLTITTGQSLTLGGVSATKVVDSMVSDSDDATAIPTRKAILSYQLLLTAQLRDYTTALTTAMCAKDPAGVVHFTGNITSGSTMAANQMYLAAMVPEGFRPRCEVNTPVVSHGNSITYLRITTLGEVYHSSASAPISIDSVSFVRNAELPSLVLQLPFISDTSDSSSYGRIGTATDITIVNDTKFTKCASFNGSTSRLLVKDVERGPEFTISVWLYLPASTPSTGQYQIINPDVTSAGTSYSYSGGRLLTLGGTNLWADNGISTPRPTLNTWFHVVITSSATMQMCGCYIDAVLKGSKSSTTANIKGMNLGGIVPSEKIAFNIAQFRLYNRILTTTEITTLYNAPTAVL